MESLSFTNNYNVKNIEESITKSYDITNNLNQAVKSMQNIPYNQIQKNMNQVAKAMQNIPYNQIQKNMNQVAKAMQNIPYNQIQKSMNQVAKVMQNIPYNQIQKNMNQLVKAMQNVPFHHFEESINVIKAIDSIKSERTFVSAFSDVKLADVDRINYDNFTQIEKEDNTDLAGTLTVREKTISEMTQEEYKEMMFGIIKKNQENSNDNYSFLNGFLKEIFKSLLITHSIQVAFIMIKIMIILITGIAADNHDKEIMNEVQSVITESSYGKAYKKIFINNNSIEKPVNKLGYLRIDTYVREGPKKTTPKAEYEIIYANTVVKIIERRGNWLKLESDTNSACFIGWVEESKIIKFVTE